MSAPRVLILGASGRIGAMLRQHWRGAALRPVWQYRSQPAPEQSIIGDPLPDRAALARLCGSADVVLALSGVVPGRGDMGLNTALALAALEIGAETGARRVFLTSSAAVYGAGGQILREDHALHPMNDYGRAKAAMELAARDRAAALGVGVTALRIGNVAGADALLGQTGTARRLDRFADGHGPRRSYIGPRVLADVLAQLVQIAARGHDLPECLNIAQPGAVAMADLCKAAGFDVTWQPAPEGAIASVILDVSRLSKLVPIPQASAQAMVAEWRADPGGVA